MKNKDLDFGVESLTLTLKKDSTLPKHTSQGAAIESLKTV